MDDRQLTTDARVAAWLSVCRQQWISKTEAYCLSNYTYLVWLFCFIGLPLLLLLRWRTLLWTQRRALAWTTIGSLVGGWLWDALAVRVGLWHYDPARIAGVWFIGLPLEEWLWIVGVTLLFGSVTILLAERMGVVHE